MSVDRNLITQLHADSREALLKVERRLITSKSHMPTQTKTIAPNLYIERDRFSVAVTMARVLGDERVLFATRRQLGANNQLDSLIETGEAQKTGADRVYLVFIHSAGNSTLKAALDEAEILQPTSLPIDQLMHFHMHFVIGENGRIVKGLRAAWSPPEPLLQRSGLPATESNLEQVRQAVEILHQTFV